MKPRPEQLTVSDSAVTNRCTVTQLKLRTPLQDAEDAFYIQIMQSTELSHMSLSPVEKLANSSDKMWLPHYSVPHAHLIVNIAIALTANKHHLIARQLFDGRKTGSLEMILRWETSLLSFCMRFCFHSSLPSPSPQWLYFSTNSTSKHYSHYKILQHSSESWGFIY